jgi:hypothetical protein
MLIPEQHYPYFEKVRTNTTNNFDTVRTYVMYRYEERFQDLALDLC